MPTLNLPVLAFNSDNCEEMPGKISQIHRDKENANVIWDHAPDVSEIVYFICMRPKDEVAFYPQKRID